MPARAPVPIGPFRRGPRRARAVRAAALGAVTVGVVAIASCGVPGRELFLVPMALRRADAIVVLGNRPPLVGGEVAPETARRVRRGVELYERGLAPILVVTGGSVRPTEAEVMARYARRLGVPPEAIVVEDRARDTAENARFTVEALCRDRDLCAPHVIVVSSPYHLRRAVTLFRCAGARVQYAAGALPDDRWERARFAAIEYGARIAYVFDDACARARPRQ